jgi:hypothetical protein
VAIKLIWVWISEYEIEVLNVAVARASKAKVNWQFTTRKRLDKACGAIPDR